MKRILTSVLLCAALLPAIPASAMVTSGDHSIDTMSHGSVPGDVLGSDFAFGPTTPGKWGAMPFGTSATVTYSFMPDSTNCSFEFSGCSITSILSGMGAIGVTEITRAFNAWSTLVSGLTFNLVADDGAALGSASNSGNIRIGMHAFDGPLGVLAHGFYPPINGNSIAGDLHFDTGECWEAGFDGTGDGCFAIFQVAAHEIGHSIGLDHTGVPDSLMNPIYTEEFSGLQADDIAGGCAIYGCGSVQVAEPGTLLLLALGLLVLLRQRGARSWRAGQRWSPASA